MVMMTDKADAPADFLLQEFLALDTPESLRAELIDGEIIVTPPPDGTHEDLIDQIAGQIRALSSVKMSVSQNKGLIVPSRGLPDEGRVIPDGTIAPADLRLFRGAPPWMLPQGVAMVLEVTSSRPEVDREAKRRAYAAAGVPLYLLIDRQRRKTTLFSGPSGDDYAHTDAAPFGSPLDLPKPFDFALDTSEFSA